MGEIWKAAAMADHFDKIQKLPDPVVGAPNFHRIPGYKVYCTGQPTITGLKNILEKVTGKIYPKEGKIIWLNLRQEPVVYVNGEPICARPPNKIASTQSWETSPETASRLTRWSSSGWLRDVSRKWWQAQVRS